MKDVLLHQTKTRLRWNYFKDRLIEKFGVRVYKIGIDAGFTCPNRDGTKAYAGCAYCSQTGSLAPHQDPTQGITEQLKKGIEFTSSRYKAEKFIAYFQAFTNTYDKVSVLRQRYDAALIDPRIVGLSIASRPDCINEENVELLKEYSNKLEYFTVELGLQSAYQNRLSWVNRKEECEDYIQAMKLLKGANIPVITHVILGFPGESQKEMTDTVELAEKCKSDGIKLQMLHVIKNTRMAHMFEKEPFPLMSRDEYVDLLIYLVERIDPQIVLHRITGETEKESLVAPDWVRHKTNVFNQFDRLLEERNTWQGRLNYRSEPRSEAPLKFDSNLMQSAFSSL